MTAEVRAFFDGAAKAFDICGSLSERKTITVESGFINVGNAIEQTMRRNVKQQNPKTKNTTSKKR